MVTGTPCSTDQDCGDGELCINETCFASRGEDEICNEDDDCEVGEICNETGLCEPEPAATECTVTADCPTEQYCNFNLESRTCVPLQEGACREPSQCDPGQLCSASPGGVGRCVECLSSADCGGNACLPDGTCTAGQDAGPGDAGPQDTVIPDTATQDTATGCSPPCNTTAGEYCVAGVCYGTNGCPLHAHPEGGSCSCDAGYVPSSDHTECVPDPGGLDAGTDIGSTDTGTPDPCLVNNLYGDGTCHTFCHQPDPDCSSQECPPNAHIEDTTCVCEQQGYILNANGTACIDGCEFYGFYDDQECDTFCALPDPDCQLQQCPLHAHPEGETCVCDSGYQWNGEACVEPQQDFCEEQGWYGDGDCDPQCPQLDIDCCPRGSYAENNLCYCYSGWVPNDDQTECVAPGEAGAACQYNGDCTFAYGAFCSTDMPGGYCSTQCTEHYQCGDLGQCNCVGAGCSSAYCFQICEFTHDCRIGYICDTWSWPGAAYGSCLPDY